MQNLPGINLEQTTEAYAQSQVDSAKSSAQNTLFADLFDRHATKVESELALTPVSTSDTMAAKAPTTAADSARDEEKPSVLESASSQKPADRTDERVEEDVRDEYMTQEDLDEVRDDLEEYGLSEEEISELEDRINSDDGLTWAEFVSTLSEKMAALKEASLSDSEQESAMSFLGKLGFSADEAKGLLAGLQGGNRAEALAAIQEKVDALPKGKQLLFTKDEVEAFSSVLNFSREFTSKLKEMLGGNTLSKNVKEAFTLISQETADMDAKDAKLVDAVAKAAIKAMDRNTKENTAAAALGEDVDTRARVLKSETSGETDKSETEQATEDGKLARETGPAENKVVADAQQGASDSQKTATDSQRAVADSHKAAKDSQDTGPKPGEKTAGSESKVEQNLENTDAETTEPTKESRIGQVLASTRTDDAKANSTQTDKNGSTAKSEVQTAAQALKDKLNASTDSDQDMNDLAENGGDDSDEVWNNFFSKLTEDTADTIRASLAAKSDAVDKAAQALGAATTTATTDKTQMWEKISAPKVMHQVEQAVIKNLANGTKQLTLQLNPENLGKLSVMLQVDGKEVNATIRAENHEAAKVIADNLNAIKTSLESQGLKVDKLEVQTGLADNQDSRNMFSQEQHNLARERQTMLAMRNHMRMMRGETTELAQELQGMQTRANSADNGLHIIA